MKKIVIEPGKKILVTLTVHERDLILNCLILEEELIEMLKIAINNNNNNISIHCTLDELEELLGYIAAEANHANDNKVVNQLDKLYDKLDKLAISYD